MIIFLTLAVISYCEFEMQSLSKSVKYCSLVFFMPRSVVGLFPAI